MKDGMPEMFARGWKQADGFAQAQAGGCEQPE